jgi:hypothetical protein
VLLPVILFGGLLWNYLGMNGDKIVHYTAGDSSPFVQSLLPNDRVSQVMDSKDGKFVSLVDEPVYFSVFAPPGNWQTADVQVSFHTGDSAVLELGALKDLFAQAFDFRPFANTIVEHLETHGWTGRPLVKLGPNVNVFLRNEYLGADPSAIKDTDIAVYRASLPWAMPTGATMTKKDNTYALPLKGSQELFTAVGNKEALRVEVKFHDLNQAVGSDEGTVRIFAQNGEMLAEAPFADDGDALGDSASTAERSVTIAPEGLPAGVYRITLSSTSDIVFDEFVTKAKYLVAKNALTLAPQTGAIALNTNAKKVTLEPLASEGLGSAMFGGSPIMLETVHKKMTGTSVHRVISPLVLPGGSEKITAEGFFALANASFWSPEPAGFSNFVTAPDEYKALVAYFPPQLRNGQWRDASAQFDLRTLAKERGAYKFVLSAPFVKETAGNVDIHSIDITFRKPAMTFHSFLSALKAFVLQLI